ncbi:MAG TPA: ribbon-helix-helix domain-containing protein [Sphingomicrobium sp.]
MNELARWSLKVSRETDIALRTLLATRGGRKGGLSRFVEDAVNRAVLRETVRDVRERNADVDEAEIEKIIEAELGAVDRSFWTEHRT